MTTIDPQIPARLRRDKRTALAADVESATNKVRAYSRALEDANDPVQDAMADRDAADDSLDLAAKTARASLAGRSVEAPRSAPYTLIFPEGIEYYTAATLDQEIVRYGELTSRLEEHLPETDQVRKDAVPVITAGVADFAAASETLNKTRTDEALAETRLNAATDAWDRLLTKVYGTLVAEVGKAAAERFFPRGKSTKKKSGE